MAALERTNRFWVWHVSHHDPEEHPVPPPIDPRFHFGDDPSFFMGILVEGEWWKSYQDRSHRGMEVAWWLTAGREAPRWPCCLFHRHSSRSCLAECSIVFYLVEFILGRF